MRIFKRYALLAATFLSVGQAWAQEDKPLVRYPDLNSDGSKMTFSYQGDIWTARLDGSYLRRLTVHEAYEYLPKWAPDDQHIAFSGDRYGNDDVYIIPAVGGVSQRMTFHSSSDALSDWTPEGKLLFSTRRNFAQVEWDNEMHQVDWEGGTPVRFMDALGEMPAQSPNGRFIAFVKGSCRLEREDYRGPANKDVWIYDTKKKSYIKVTDHEGNDFLPVWAGDATLYFISAASGRYNVHKLKLDDKGQAQGQPLQVTDFTEYGVLYFDVSTDGKVLAAENFGNIYKMDLPNGTPQKVELTIPVDYRFDPMERKVFSNGIEDYSVNKKGELSALEIRGEIFVTENDKEKSRAMNISDHPFRDRNPEWLNDSTLIFSSDREGQYDLYMAKSSDKKQTSIFRTLKRELTRLTETEEDETNPHISPDGKKIAYTRNGNQLVVAEINKKGKLTKENVLHEGWNAPSGVAWSPDSKWLAYSMPNLDFNYEVYIQPADNSKKPVNVSMHPKYDLSPVWSPDGTKLAFVTNRGNRDYDVWFVWLSKEEWEKTKLDREEGFYYPEEPEEKDESSDKDTKDKKKDGKKEKEPKPVKIDFENIHNRLEQVTSLPGDESDIAIDIEGELIYFTAKQPGSKNEDLFSVKYDGTELKAVTSGGQEPNHVRLDSKGDHLFYVSKGRLVRLDVKKNKTETLPHQAAMVIDHHNERKQVFEEAWRMLDKNFYDPQFHGYDFDGLKKDYEPLAMRASTDRDFRAMFNLMIGQLNASHMGLYGSDRAETQRESTGRLGVEVEPLDEGVKVRHVVPDSPADKSFSKLEKGDVILSVNGEPITEDKNFYALLANYAAQELMLEIKGKDEPVIIRPASSLRVELYEEWVRTRQELVEKYSNGRLGYIHIQGMNMPSFERFERELMASGYGKEGIVIDVRFNGGGWTTDYLMTVLNVRQHAYTVPRGATENLEDSHTEFSEHYPYGERLPLSAWVKPSIALCNSSSYSNAEIFSHAYKNLDIGTLVGEPTFGAVISTGGSRLLDGSFVRMPFRAWYAKQTGENMENGPAVPDIIVHNAPDYRATGDDTQLKKAVDQLLKEIDEK